MPQWVFMPDSMIPEIPPATSEGQDGGTAVLVPRYEDIAQDGRMQLAGMLPGMGQAVWSGLLGKVPGWRTLRKQGIYPIFHRLVVEGEERSCSTNAPIHVKGAFRLAHEKDGERIFLLIWLDSFAAVGATHSRTPREDAPRELVGRMWAEHVFTRPLGAPGERRVTRLVGEGLPEVPPDAHRFEDADMLLRETAPLETLGEHVFTKMHTDSNRHVNSLVYPRLFEEHLVQRLARDGVPNAAEMLSRGLDIRWRKPFFLGETATLKYRILSKDPYTVAGGFFGKDPERPHTMLKMVLR